MPAMLIRSWLLILFIMAVQSGCRLASSPPEKWRVEVVASYPHDPAAYTQGLNYHQNRLYESTGLYGQSSVREVELTTGKVLHRLNLLDTVFGEGMTLLNGRIWVLTWREQTAYEIDPVNWTITGSKSYIGEGWGLTSDGTDLIKSDGTSSLTWIDPTNFSVKSRRRITEGNKPVMNLNELEWVENRIFANVYMQDRIVQINPRNGKVNATIDLSGLRSLLPQPNQAEALNGIAWNAENKTLLVTGKNWPLLFELRLVK